MSAGTDGVADIAWKTNGNAHGIQAAVTWWAVGLNDTGIPGGPRLRTSAQGASGPHDAIRLAVAGVA